MRTRLLASTFTPGSTAPEASFAIPAIPALVCCANVAAGTASIQTAAAMRPNRDADTIMPPLREFGTRCGSDRREQSQHERFRDLKWGEPTPGFRHCQAQSRGTLAAFHSFGADDDVT